MIKIEICAYCKRQHYFGVYSVNKYVWCSAECRAKHMNVNIDYAYAIQTVNDDRKNKYLKWLKYYE